MAGTVPCVGSTERIRHFHCPNLHSLGWGRQVNSHYAPVSSVLCHVPQEGSGGLGRDRSREQGAEAIRMGPWKQVN